MANRCRSDMAWLIILQVSLMTILVPPPVEGHGRLMEPPARNSMWRFGYPNPVNYNDNELFCGGYAVQWEQNKGKCGLCGDPYHVEEPRPHEAGGLYAKGIITRRYTVGQEIDIEVELTANHQGRFEVHLCPNNNPSREASQLCLDRFPLHVVASPGGGGGGGHFWIPEETPKTATFRYKVQLPPYLTCTQCVMQWTYFTGNMWGICENGTEAQGCGKSETFRNCADVSVLSNVGGNVPPLFAGSAAGKDNPFLLYYRDFRKPAPYNVYPLVVRDQVCVPTTLYRSIPGMRSWCMTNCLRYPPNCPELLCTCPHTCDAIGELEGRDGADIYCMDKCLVSSGSSCPTKRCSCHE